MFEERPSFTSHDEAHTTAPVEQPKVEEEETEKPGQTFRVTDSAGNYIGQASHPDHIPGMIQKHMEDTRENA
ncbi:MAG: hypothetical protein JWN49_488 [Parcubacteria group bacterium]|nr:hypothetical protein [Parcubacteria group bacterium]